METDEVFVSFDFTTGHVCLNPFMGTDHSKNITFLRRVRLPSKRQIKPLRTSIYILWLHSPSGPGPPPCRVEVSRSHSDTPHSVGLLCTSDRPVAETST